MAAGKIRASKRAGRKLNPAAKALRTPAYRPRVVKSKKAYTRKPRGAKPADA